MTWRCDSAAVSVWVDKIMCCWWRPEFAVQHSAEKDLYDQLEKALNPGDKIAVIEREYEEAAEGIYESYQRQIDDIKKSMTDSQQYKDLLAKTQNLEDIRDTKGLTAKQEAQLQPKIPYQLYICQPMFSPKSSIISL